MDEILLPWWTALGCEGAERRAGGQSLSLSGRSELSNSQWLAATWSTTTFHFAIITTGRGFENFLFSHFCFFF
jgi:hypothetical protein